MCNQYHAYHRREIRGILAPFCAMCPYVTRGDAPVLIPISVHYTESVCGRSKKIIHLPSPKLRMEPQAKQKKSHLSDAAPPIINIHYAFSCYRIPYSQLRDWLEKNTPFVTAVTLLSLLQFFPDPKGVASLPTQLFFPSQSPSEVSHKCCRDTRPGLRALNGSWTELSSVELTTHFLSL